MELGSAAVGRGYFETSSKKSWGERFQQARNVAAASQGERGKITNDRASGKKNRKLLGECAEGEYLEGKKRQFLRIIAPSWRAV